MRRNVEIVEGKGRKGVGLFLLKGEGEVWFCDGCLFCGGWNGAVDEVGNLNFLEMVDVSIYLSRVIIMRLFY